MENKNICLKTLVFGVCSIFLTNAALCDLNSVDAKKAEIKKKTDEFTKKKRSNKEINAFIVSMFDEMQSEIIKKEKDFTINDKSSASNSQVNIVEKGETKSLKNKKTNIVEPVKSSETPKVLDFNSTK